MKTMPLSVPTIKAIGLSLVFIVSAALVLFYVYPTAIFLSAYPASLLSYYYFATSVLEISLAFLLQPILSRSKNTTVAILLIFGALVVLLFLYFLHQHSYYTTFVFTVYLDGLSLILVVAAWNAFRNSLNIIEYKNLSGIASTSVSLGAILTSASVAAILKVDNVSLLGILIVVTVIVAAFLIMLLPILTTSSIKPTKSTPFLYPLYIRMFQIILLVAIVYTLCEFCLKNELATYSANQIAHFIAEFNFVCGVLALVVSYFGINYILYKYDIIGLYLVLPIYWLITGLMVFIYPSLSTIVLLASGKLILYYTIFYMGRDITLNVFPINIKNTGQIFLKSLAAPVAGIVASIIIFVFSKNASINVFGGIIVILSVLIIYLISAIKHLYRHTLRDSLFLNDFTTENLSKKDIDFLRNSIFNSLSLDQLDLDNTNMLLSLIPKLNASSLPSTLYKYIHSASVPVRLSILSLIKSFQARGAIQDIIKQIEPEENESVLWQLIDTAASLQMQEEITNQYTIILKKTDSDLHYIALRLMIKSSNKDQIYALEAFNKLINSTKPKERIKAAKLLPYFSKSQIENYKLLINDLDADVAGEAIASAAVQKRSDLLPTIISRVIKGRIPLHYRQRLSVFSDHMIPFFIKNIPILSSKRLVDVRQAISYFATMPSPLAEAGLIEVAKNAHLLVKHYIIQCLAHRALTILPTQETINFINNHILFDISYIATLVSWKIKIGSSIASSAMGDKMPVATEITNRITLAKERLLFSLIIVNKQFDLFNLISIIIDGNQVDQAKAIEYLLTIITHSSFKKTIELIFANKTITTETMPIESLNDELLTKIVNTIEDKSMMDELQKLYFLRKVKIFKRLPAEDLLIIADQCVLKEIKTNEIIYKPGEFALGFYIVFQGEVIESYKDKIKIHKKYDVFGEIALMSNESYRSQAIAKDNCTVLFLNKQSYDKIIDDMPELSRSIVNYLLEHIKENELTEPKPL